MPAKRVVVMRQRAALSWRPEAPKGHVKSSEKPSGFPPGLTTPSAAYAWRHGVVIAGSVCALLVAAYLCAAHSPYPWIAVLLLPFLGTQIYKITITDPGCAPSLAPCAANGSPLLDGQFPVLDYLPQCVRDGLACA